MKAFETNSITTMELSLRRTLVQLIYASAKCSLVLFFFTACLSVTAQTTSPVIVNDTTTLDAVTVTAFSSGLTWKDVPASVAIINKQQLQRYDNTSLVPVLNTVPGVRMEERSPGSYRLSIRGSLLRSPFGVRNIKIYMDDVPLTDATGNTYLNLIDLNQLKSAEIIKGPSASFYGANTGGALILHTNNAPGFEAGLSGGSFGAFKAYAGIQKSIAKLEWGLQQSHTQSDGYRQQSALRKDVVQLNTKWKISPATSVSFLGFYSDLHYETPGGLTKRQMDSLPFLARLPSGPTPGAIAQHAGVYNKTVFASAAFRSSFAKHFNNTTSFVVTHTDFKNPFITNYEKRNEWNYSGRTNFQYEYAGSNAFSIKANAGGELQYGTSHINVYDNNQGVTGNNQYKDKVHITQYFLFAQLNIAARKWLLQAGLSNNNLRYVYDRISDSTGINPVTKKTGSIVSPRFGLTFIASKELSLFVSAAKGFSPPTLAEVLPSSGSFYAELNPESGWNYETGIKGSLIKSRIIYNASFYYFALQNAIVQKTDANGAAFFVNAGGTIQKGVELWLDATLIKSNNGFIQSLNVWNSLSYQPYRFNNYKSGANDYSGNKLTGVPRYINVSGIDLATKYDYTLNVTFNYTDAIPLNDANLVFAKSYHLLQLKLGKAFSFSKIKLQVFAGADNLLNEVYSLGNDINAVAPGGNITAARYFNPALSRNYYGGVRFNF